MSNFKSSNDFEHVRATKRTYKLTKDLKWELYRVAKMSGLHRKTGDVLEAAGIKENPFAYDQILGMTKSEGLAMLKVMPKT